MKRLLLIPLLFLAPAANAVEAVCQLEGKVVAVDQLSRPVNGLGIASQQPYTQVKVQLRTRSVLEHGNQEEDACADPKADKPVIGVYDLAPGAHVNVGDMIRAKSQFKLGSFWASTVLYDIELVAAE